MLEKGTRISVVVPVYNESGNIEELYNRLKNTGQSFPDPFEIIFVNDGSIDDSLGIMNRLASLDRNVKVVDLSRNFGHQAAIKAGLGFVSGDAAVIMDADLQDPPELIKELAEKWSGGYQVVYAVRKTRKEGALLRFLYFSFYRLLKVISKIEIPLDAGDFCLLDKKIVDILAGMPEKDPFLRGLRSWVGYSQIGVEYDRKERHSGKSKYNFFRLLKLALDGILSFSNIPLRLAAFLGFVVSGISVVQIIVLFIKRLPVPGTTAIAVIVLFLGGVQLISIGIIGEYLGRIYEESKNRPLFIIKNKTNL